MSPRYKAAQTFARAVVATGPVEPGISPGWSIEVGDNLVAEISVTFRRVVSAESHRDHVAGALAELWKHPYRADKCCVTVNRGGGRFTARPERQCSGKVSVAIAMELGGYHFVCSQHRSGHGFTAARVLAVVTLPPADLVALRQLAAEQHAEAVRLEEAQRVARLAAELPAFADPAGMDGWTYHTGLRRWHREVVMDDAGDAPVVSRDGVRIADSRDRSVATMIVLLTDSADITYEVLDGPEGARRLRGPLGWGVEDTRAGAVAACLRTVR